MRRALTCLVLAIFYALVVLLVPSSAWSAGTALPASSLSSSLSHGSLSAQGTLARLDPTQPEPTPTESPETPPEPSPSPTDLPSSEPSVSEPATFSDVQIKQLQAALEPEFAAMADPATDCGYDTHPPCAVSLETDQWATVNEGLVVGVTALSVLVLVGLTRLLGGWGRRER